MLAFTAALQTVFKVFSSSSFPLDLHFLSLVQPWQSKLSFFLFPSWLSQWSLVILICVSLIPCVVWHFFVCSFTIYIYYLCSQDFVPINKEKYLFVPLLRSPQSSLSALRIKTRCQICGFRSFFSCFLAYWFILWTMPLGGKSKLFAKNKSSLPRFFFFFFFPKLYFWCHV